MQNDIWAITTLYHFYPTKKREANFYAFRDNLARQGVKLACLEIAGPAAEFLLGENDADLMIQLKTNSLIWHKERALNLLIDRLPANCKYVAWFDADCVMERNDWPEAGVELLQTHCAIQLCSHIKFQKEDGTFGKAQGTYLLNSTGTKRFGLTDTGARVPGAPGFCWMMRKDLVSSLKIYDKAIIGGGDVLFAAGAMFNDIGKSMVANGDPGSAQYKDYVYWYQRFIKGVKQAGLKRATYLDGHSSHLWHDERKYRLYGARHFLLLLEDYHPLLDVDIEESTGLYTIVNDRIKRHLEIYFWFREQEKTPEHDRLFNIYEFLMETLKDVGQVKRGRTIEQVKRHRENQDRRKAWNEQRKKLGLGSYAQVQKKVRLKNSQRTTSS